MRGREAEDAHWMALALTEAARGLGRTAPNPPVGCVLVRNGELVGRGFHARAGDPHAEAMALREAGPLPAGATAYVTLEPCAHHGRTPPCADALIAAGVGRVVVAALDPNPLVGGAGVARLQAAGLKVTLGPGEEEALRQQAGFRSLMVRGRPWVVAKYAMTLDGRVAASGEGRGQVSGPDAQAHTMRWRNSLDAIAVGSGTVELDHPRLTTRGIEGGRDPRPVVFDRRARTPTAAFGPERRPVLVTSRAASTGPHEAAGWQIIRADTLTDGLHALGRLNLSSVLLEGGPTLLSAFLAEGLVDELRVFVAPKLLGAGLSPLLLTGELSPQRMAAARPLHDVQAEVLGPDVLISGFLNDIPRLRAGGN